MAVLDLADIPDGTRVFVDTNIFVYHFLGKSVSCTSFVNRVARRDIQAFVNSRVMLDLLHKLMLADAIAMGVNIVGMDGDTRPWKLERWLSKDRSRGALLMGYQSHFEAAFSMGIDLIRTTKDLLIETRHERLTFGLMAGDSVHMGCMLRYAPPIVDIATNDDGFAHVPTVTIWKPVDVVP